MKWYLTVLRKYAKFSGRAQRAEYWYFILISIIISIILIMLDNGLGLYNNEEGVGVFSGLYSLVVFIPAIAVATRRLHDIGKSGWWQLIAIIPIIGFIIIIIWLSTDSKEDNQYGENPKKNTY